MATFVLTVIGDDRSGLVDALAGVIAEQGGNWRRSQMARLAGKFAGIVEVEIPDARADDLRSALAPLEERGLLDIGIDVSSPTTPLDGPRFLLSLVGTDRPGLVHAVTQTLLAVGASIDELDTSTYDAPMSGEPIFEAHATVVLPGGSTIDDVRDRLEALADHLMVDIDLND